jgi:hypothetical protein
LFAARLRYIFGGVEDAECHALDIVLWLCSLGEDIRDINIERYMSATVTTDVASVDPDSAFIVNSAEPSENSDLLCFLLRGARVVNFSLVPYHFVDLLLVDAGGRTLEDIRHFDGSYGILR